MQRTPSQPVGQAEPAEGLAHRARKWLLKSIGPCKRRISGLTEASGVLSEAQGPSILAGKRHNWRSRNGSRGFLTCGYSPRHQNAHPNCFSQASNPYHSGCRSQSRALRDSPPVCTGGHHTHLTCTRRRWAGWRQWRRRQVRCWLQHLSGLLRRLVGAQRTWSKWRLVWKHCIDMSHSGKNKGELRRGVWRIHQQHLKTFRYVFSISPFLPCAIPFLTFLWPPFFYTQNYRKDGWKNLKRPSGPSHFPTPRAAKPFQQNSLPFF